MTERSMTLPQGRVTGSSINVAMIGSRNSSGTSCTIRQGGVRTFHCKQCALLCAECCMKSNSLLHQGQSPRQWPLRV